MSKNLSVIIPTAGSDKKMRGFECKSLIKLNDGLTVLKRQEQIIHSVFPNSEIILVVGYNAEKILPKIHRKIKVVENENFESTNVARSIGMGLRVTTHPNVLIIYGDLVFNKSALNFYTNESCVIVDSLKRFDNNSVGVTVVNGRATYFAYDLKTKWCQIVYLTGRELDIYREIVLDKNHSRWFGFEVLNKVIESGGKIRAIEPPRMKIVEIDNSQDLARAQLL